MATFVKTGAANLGISRDKHAIIDSTRVASGVYIKESIKAGTALSSHGGSGTKSGTYERSGTAILGVFPGDTGAAELGYVASGANAIEYTRSGQATRTYVGDGSANLGLGVIDKAGGGSGGTGTPGYGLISLSVAAGYSASGVKVFESTGAIFTKTGGGTSGNSASASDSVTSSETGLATSVLSASGPDVSESIETGISVSNRTGSAARIAEKPRVGSATQEVVGSGAKAVTYVRTGAGVLTGHAFGSGTSPGIFSKSGDGVITRVASGDNTNTYPESGAGTVSASGSGTFIRLITKSGAATKTYTASSERSKLVDSTGTGTRRVIGSATKRVEYRESGVNVFGLEAGSPSEVQAAVVYEKTGLGELILKAGPATNRVLPGTLRLMPLLADGSYKIVATPIPATRKLIIDGLELELVYD